MKWILIFSITLCTGFAMTNEQHESLVQKRSDARHDQFLKPSKILAFEKEELCSTKLECEEAASP